MTTATDHPPSVERPTWLRRRPPPLPQIVVPASAEPASVEVTPKTAWEALIAGVRWWFSIEFGWGLVVSGGVHLVALGALSLMVFGASANKPATTIEGMFVDTGTGDGNELDIPGDNRLDEELSSARATPVDFVDLSATLALNPNMAGAAERIAGALGGDGDSQGTGFGGNGSGGMGGKIGVPSTAVTKGSFTVWTDPEDPVPSRNYEIVIQVKVPPGISSYRLRDLTGTVRGTDNYFKPIKFDSTQRRGVKDGVVQVRIPIPGAAELVRDTIRIRSEILKEEQLIEIKF